jgi:hypothetical protein
VGISGCCLVVSDALSAWPLRGPGRPAVVDITHIILVINILAVGILDVGIILAFILIVNILFVVIMALLSIIMAIITTRIITTRILTLISIHITVTWVRPLVPLGIVLTGLLQLPGIIINIPSNPIGIGITIAIPIRIIKSLTARCPPTVSLNIIVGGSIAVEIGRIWISVEVVWTRILPSIIVIVSITLPIISTSGIATISIATIISITTISIISRSTTGIISIAVIYIAVISVAIILVAVISIAVILVTSASTITPAVVSVRCPAVLVSVLVVSISISVSIFS